MIRCSKGLDINKMNDDIDSREQRKLNNKNNFKKNKPFISDDQKFANKARKAFKHRKLEIKEEELLEDLEDEENYRFKK